MKEDAQLTCPISYEDPDNKWDLLQPILQAELPLREVSWKSPISASSITIDKLPLRFLPSSATLFKDTEHAFRWLLAPYVQFYILVAETLDAYKAAKGNVRKWIDTRNANRPSLAKCPYFIVYLPLGTQTLEVYNKVNYRISSDFYVDRAGDHSVMVLLPHLIDESNPQNILSRRPAHPSSSSSLSFSLNLSSHHGVQSLVPPTTQIINATCLLREGIVRSFQQRCAMYDSEIRRLDSARGSQLFDFRQLFLVKESLALMYQMLQLFDMALAQYEELEVILSYAQIAALPDSDWPMVGSSDFKMDSSHHSSGGMGGSSSHGGESMQSAGLLHAATHNVPTEGEADEQGGNQASASAGSSSHTGTNGNGGGMAGGRQPSSSFSSSDPTAAAASSSSRDGGGGLAASGGSSKDREKDIMSDAVKNGDDIAAYSINMARMKILKNKMTLLELHRYVYARQMYFLILLQRPVQCAQNSRTFLLFCYNYVLKRYSLSAGEGSGLTSAASAASSYSASDEGEAAGGGGPRLVAGGLSETQIKYIRYQQLQVWALTAGVKIVRVCRDLIAKMCTNGLDVQDFVAQSLMNVTRARQMQAGSQGAPTTTTAAAVSTWQSSVPSSSGTSTSLSFPPAPSRSATPPPRSLSIPGVAAAGADPSSSIQLGHVLVQSASAGGPGTSSESAQPLSTTGTPAGSAAGSSEGLDSKRHLFKEAYIVLAEILQFCMCRLHKLTPVCSYARAWTSHHCLTTTSLQAAWGALKEEHTQRMQRVDDFFLPFVQQESSRSMMQQELDSLRTDKPDSLSNVLVSLSQRLRSVSHCWAKIYCTMPVDFSNAEVWNTERDYLAQRNKVGFSRVQTERGLVLECAVALLLREGLWELFTLSDRFRLAYACKVDCVAVLVAAHQFEVASPMAEDICRLEGTYLSHYTSTDVVPKAEALWAVPLCGWEELQRYVLAMLRRAALGAGSWERERTTVAALLLHHLLGRPSLAGGALEASGLRIRRPSSTARVVRGGGGLSADVSRASAPSEVEVEVEESVHHAAMQELFDALVGPLRRPEGLVPMVLPLPHFWAATLSLPHATRTSGRLLCDEVSYRVCVSSVSVTTRHPLSLTLHWRAPFLPAQALLCHKVEIVWRRIQQDDAETVRGFGDLFLPRNLQLAYQGAMASRINNGSSDSGGGAEGEPTPPHASPRGVDLASPRMVTTSTEEVVLDPRASPEVTLPFVLVPQATGVYLVEHIVLHCEGVVFFDAPLASRCRTQHAQWCAKDRSDVRLTQAEFQSALDANFVVHCTSPPCADGVLAGAVAVPHCSVLHTTDHLVVQLSTARDEEVEHITIHTQCTGPATALTSSRALLAGARPGLSWRLGDGPGGSGQGAAVSFVSDGDVDSSDGRCRKASTSPSPSPLPGVDRLVASTTASADRVHVGDNLRPLHGEESAGEAAAADEVTVTVAAPADWVIDLRDTSDSQPAGVATHVAQAAATLEAEDRGVHIPAHRAVTILIPYVVSVPAAGQRLGYAIPIAVEVCGLIRYTGTGSSVGFHIRATATLRGAQLLQGRVRRHAVHTAEATYCYDARVSNVSPLPLVLAGYGLFAPRAASERGEEEEEQEEEGVAASCVLTPHPLPFVSRLSQADSLRTAAETSGSVPPVVLLPGEDWRLAVLVAGAGGPPPAHLTLFYWRAPEAVYPGTGDPNWVATTVSSLSLVAPAVSPGSSSSGSSGRRYSEDAVPFPVSPWMARGKALAAVHPAGPAAAAVAVAVAAAAPPPPRLLAIQSPFRSAQGVCTVFHARLDLSGLLDQRTLDVHYQIHGVEVVYEAPRRHALAQCVQSHVRMSFGGQAVELAVQESPWMVALGLHLPHGGGESPAVARGHVDCQLVCIAVCLGECALPSMCVSLLQTPGGEAGEQGVVYTHVYPVSEGPGQLLVLPAMDVGDGGEAVPAWPGPAYQLAARPDLSATVA